MFLPIGDDNSDRKSTPIVNYLLIALNILAFVFWQEMGNNIHVLLGYATVPAEILTGHDVITKSIVEVDPITNVTTKHPGLQTTPIPVYLTLITSMFMHGGWAHLGGNMLFLYVFGDNLEDAMGHLKYLFFYLLCGVIASLAHVLATYFLGGSLLTPSVGASGAISAVLGGYMWLFPTRKVHMWIFIFIISVPALVAVGVWFVFQVINGLGALDGEDAGGIAYAAHIGGFIAGLLLVNRFARKNKVVRQGRFR